MHSKWVVALLCLSVQYYVAHWFPDNSWLYRHSIASYTAPEKATKLGGSPDQRYTEFIQPVAILSLHRYIIFAYREVYKNEHAQEDDGELLGGFMPCSSSSEEEISSGDEQ